MKKLLLVDDSTTMRKIILGVLRRADLSAFDVLEASNGDEALERLSSNPDVALVLSDVHMPGMDGVGLVRAIRARHSKDALPVVMLTTEGARGLATSAVGQGANGWVEKPFTPETIRAELARYLD